MPAGKYSALVSSVQNDLKNPNAAKPGKRCSSSLQRYKLLPNYRSLQLLEQVGWSTVAWQTDAAFPVP